MKRKLFDTKAELESLYIDQQLTTVEIGKILNVCPATVETWLKKSNIPLRTRSESRIGKHYSPRTEWEKGCPAPPTAFKKGHTPWNKGKTGVYSAEHLQHMAEVKRGCISPNKGKSLSAEAKSKLSVKLRGRPAPNKGKHASAEVRQKLSKSHIGKKLSVEQRQHISEAHKIRGTPTTAERAEMLKGLMRKPTKPERGMDDLLQCHFPSEWRYVGNGEVIIGGLNPDFININGEKAIIEVFGEVFHDPKCAFMEIPYNQQEDGRGEIYSQYGFKMLVVWASELEQPLAVAEKVRRFMVGASVDDEGVSWSVEAYR